MDKIYTLATALLTFAFALASYAAIPVRWTTDAYKVKPLVYECYHGETLDLAAALTAYGEPLNFAGKTAKLYWQTNGMDRVWWSTNAFVRAESGATNILAAIWSGAYDTGAASVTGFIGVEGENYRAAFQLNFRASPGFVPNQLPMPIKVINWATVGNENIGSAPFEIKGGQRGIGTNEVSGIITNHVNSGYLCTSNAAVALAGAAEARAKAASLSLAEGGVVVGDTTFVGELTAEGGFLSHGNSSFTKMNESDVQTVIEIKNGNQASKLLGNWFYKGNDDDHELATLGDITVSWDATASAGAKLKHGETAVTAADVGALATSWATNPQSTFAGGAEYANNAVSAISATSSVSAETLWNPIAKMWITPDYESDNRWLVTDETLTPIGALAYLGDITDATNGLITSSHAYQRYYYMGPVTNVLEWTNDQNLDYDDYGAFQLSTVDRSVVNRFGISASGAFIESVYGGISYKHYLPNKGDNTPIALTSDIPNSYTKSVSDSRYAVKSIEATVATHTTAIGTNASNIASNSVAIANHERSISEIPSIAANSALSVYQNNADYKLRSYVGKVGSGEIANITNATSTTQICIDFTNDSSKSGDCMVVLEAAENGVLTVTNGSFSVISFDATFGSYNANTTNLFMFLKIASDKILAVGKELR